MNPNTDPEEQALVRAICAQPFDDLPRLIAADYLEENHQVERAEFIRVQVELENHPACEWKGTPVVCPYRGNRFCDSCERRRALRERERKLLEYFAAEDMAQRFGLRPHETLYAVDSGYTVPGAGVELRFSRGFVHKVECTFREFMGGECVRCSGTGVQGVAEIWEGDYVTGFDSPECPTCQGTGRTPDLVDTLFRVHPVMEVRITSFVPRLGMMNVGWPCVYRGSPAHGNRQFAEGREEHYLPAELFDLLPECVFTARRDMKQYKTTDELGRQISTAAVSLGRKRAGLPPI